ncbi:MAG: FlgO family outer membrane protein [bacterium]|nr:FlgO family outer membrane protein [bacterium]
MKKDAWKKFYFICFLSIIFSLSGSGFSMAYEKEISALSATMAENITQAGRKTIAVVDFTDLQGNVTELGRFLAEEFSVALAGAGKGFEVIDRTHLKALLKEHKLAFSDLVNPESAKKLGQIAGVEAIITGSLTPFGESVRLTIKILDVSTAKVIGATAGNIPKTQAINELLARGIEAEVQAQDVSKPIQTISSQKPTKAQQSVEVDDFLFEVKECKISNTTITCNLIITNKDKNDREIMICGCTGSTDWTKSSRIFDDFGNEYCPEGIELGNHKDRCARNLLVSDVPTRLTFKIETVSKNVSKLSLLEIPCYRDNKWIIAQLRNIPITK